jgi:hypothetical protein
MENAGMFYGHLKYSTVIRYILWSFGNVVVIWYILPRFGKLCHEKSGNPDRHHQCCVTQNYRNLAILVNSTEHSMAKPRTCSKLNYFKLFSKQVSKQVCSAIFKSSF